MDRDFSVLLVGETGSSKLRTNSVHQVLPWRERLLDAGFRALCKVMSVAARCSGVAIDDPHPRACVDFQALALSGWVPLGEIATAQRELGGRDRH